MKLPQQMVIDEFTSCDWGTSSLRVRKVRNGCVEKEFSCARGVASVCPSDSFPGILRESMAKIGAKPPVVISGMASSSIGWCELDYACLPFSLDGSDAIMKEIDKAIWLISGVRGEAEIMRGEETELLGLELNDEQLLVILPGTHSKHCTVKNGKLIKFQTFMTGELRQIFRSHTILAKSISDGWDGDAFCEGIRAGATMPLTAGLFQVRTRQLLCGCTGASNGSFLDGMLIGAELSQLPGEIPILLASGIAQNSAYRMGLEVLGLTHRTTILAPEETSVLAVRGHLRLLELIQPG